MGPHKYIFILYIYLYVLYDTTRCCWKLMVISSSQGDNHEGIFVEVVSDLSCHPLLAALLTVVSVMQLALRTFEGSTFFLENT